MHHWKWRESDYLTYTKDQKAFTQQVLFIDYMEEWEDIHFSKGSGPLLYNMLLTGLIKHEETEDYETCQLYTDVLDRYELDIIQLDNK